MHLRSQFKFGARKNIIAGNSAETANIAITKSATVGCLSLEMKMGMLQRIKATCNNTWKSL